MKTNLDFSSILCIILVLKIWHFSRKRLVPLRVNKYLIKWEKDSCSKIQTKVKKFLYPYWKYYTVLEEYRIPGCLLRIDLLCLNSKIAIEVSPTSHHGTFNKFFHKNSRANYFNSIKKDFQKAEYLEFCGFNLIELDENDVDNLSLNYIKDKFGISIL